MPARVARVLPDSPLPQLDQLYDYLIPERLAERAVPGSRVRMPFRHGTRLMCGWLVECVEESSYQGELAQLHDVITEVPPLTPAVWQLVRACADRAAGNAADLLRLAVPPRHVQAERAVAALRDAAHSGDDLGTDPQATPKCDVTATTPNPPTAAATPGLRATATASNSPTAADAREIGAVVAAALAPGASGFEIEGYPGLVDAVLGGARLAVRARPMPLPVSDEQGAPWVGAWAVTVAEVAAAMLGHGRSAILVVPDHRDLTQLLQALAPRTRPDDVLRVDAGVSAVKRYRAHLRATLPRPHIIVGNRASVWAPAHNLGLLAIWDDGDPLYIEPRAPYVHTRDTAFVRQEQSGCGLVLLAHTRSAETQRAVEVGWLREGVSGSGSNAPKPRPRVVLTETQSGPGLPTRIPESAFQAAQVALRRGPVLIQVGRPGHIPNMACATCGAAAVCPVCAGVLGREVGGPPPASCRVCGRVATGWHCPECDGSTLRAVVIGASRTVEELGPAFPGVRVILATGVHSVLEVDERPALVVATRGAEPLARGGYQAVILLDAARMLLRESLRVEEDCLRWWSNAAALAAPGATVFLTGVGSGPLGTAFATWMQPDWAYRELRARTELRFPPAVRIATVTGPPPQVSRVLDAVRALALAPGECDVLGPYRITPDEHRGVLRFAYRYGATVAQAVRAAHIVAATERPSPGRRSTASHTWARVRFDDPDLATGDASIGTIDLPTGTTAWVLA